MGAPPGRCRLCLQEAVELRDSHIVPAWAYRRLVSGLPKPARPVVVRDGTAILTDKQVTEYMLCDSCEQRFSDWEKYASQVLAQEDGTFPWLGQSKVLVATGAQGELGYLDSTAMDSAKLCLFAASVVWRASASKKACPRVSLGRYEEAFRRYLLGLAPFPQTANLIVYLQTPPKTALPSANQVVTLPTQLREAGYSRHWFVLCGAAFYLFVGGLLPALFARLCFARSGRALSIPADSLMRGLGESALESKAKGLLARMNLTSRATTKSCP